MRFPHVISENTKTVYKPSQDCSNLLNEEFRQTHAENLEWGDDHFPTLVTLCILVISKNFEKRPILEELPCDNRDELLEILSTTLPLELVIPLIDHEIYWKRKYAEKFGKRMERLYPGWTWKRIFIEKNMQEVLENAQPQYQDEFNMDEILTLSCPYVTHLAVTQLQQWIPPLTMEKDDYPEVYPVDHINFEPVLNKLGNIEEFDVIYGMNHVMEDFDWRMFKLSANDCKHLGVGVLSLGNLSVLKIRRSSLQDDHIQALTKGLVDNRTLIELDLSHCQIGDRGTLCIAKLLMVHPTLQVLNLEDNLIAKIGGEGLGFALLEENSCPLDHLNLRLNPLKHEGVMGILRSLVRGSKPRKLNLAATLFEDDTPIRVGQMLAINSTLEELDVSNNWFGDEGAQALIKGLEVNNMLKWFDVRETDISESDLVVINKKIRFNRYGESEEEESEDVEDDQRSEVTEDQDEKSEAVVQTEEFD